MSLKHSGEWHYEYIEGRDKGHEWRVADSDDDVVRDFPIEEQARDYVRKHNAGLPAKPAAWRF